MRTRMGTAPFRNFFGEPGHRVSALSPPPAPPLNGLSPGNSTTTPLQKPLECCNGLARPRPCGQMSPLGVAEYAVRTGTCTYWSGSEAVTQTSLESYWCPTSASITAFVGLSAAAAVVLKEEIFARNASPSVLIQPKCQPHLIGLIRA